MHNSVCLFCGRELCHTFVDLGMQPLCESYISPEQLDEMEPFYPLHVRVCDRCWLVQLRQYVSPAEIFTEYAYFSSYSESWVEHARQFTEAVARRLHLSPSSQVIEVGSNDGYLLQHFAARGIPVLGIEPAGNVAAAARAKHIPTLEKFFGAQTARELAAQGRKADLIVANNVLAQSPDINDFLAGLHIALAETGVITIEVPHLLRLVENNQFDTIYHEHFFYFSLGTMERMFAAHGLELFDVEELTTHGGSLRIYGQLEETGTQARTRRVADIRTREKEAGMADLAWYTGFAQRVRETKRNLLACLIEIKRRGSSLVGYGAPGKGNTLLNYCGIGCDFLEYTVDRNPYKQGRFLPGTHIPIHPPERIQATKPDYILVLPWNLKHEILPQLQYIREWGGRFILPIPHVEVL